MKVTRTEPRYRFGATIIASRAAQSCDLDLGDGADAQTIRSAYRKGLRPQCLCQTPNPPLYLCRLDGRYVIKRMPGTGPLHAPCCLHYQPFAGPALLCEATRGSAVYSNDGPNLKLAFELSKKPRHHLQVAAHAPSPPPTARLHRLKGFSLLALLHLLWQSAELNRWHPAFAGRRHWRTVRTRLQQAAARVQVKARPLLDRLYIPETFSRQQKQAIRHRQTMFLHPFRAGRQGERELILLIAEIKDITPARYGFRLSCKHAPQLAVFIDQKALNRLHKGHASALALHQAYPHSHLMLVATAGITLEGAVRIEQGALMLVTQHWIACESDAEMRLLDTLVSDGRMFLKHFHPAHRNEQSAALWLNDTRPPTALVILDRPCDPTVLRAIADRAQQSGFLVWTWNPAEAVLPDLPHSDRRPV